MATFTKRIDADIRDLDHTLYEGSWSVNVSSAYNIGNPGSVTRNVGLRFTGVNIPQGSEITSAKITFLAPHFLYDDQNCNNRIIGVDEDNTAEFVASPENSARTRTHTTAYVNWGNVDEIEDSTFDTPDLKTIVQEIVDRGGWSSGNAMAFYLYDNGSSSGNYIQAEEYSSGSTKSALLTIEYVEAGSPSPSPTPSSSPSLSPSLSPSSSQSNTPSPSSSISPSPSPIEPFFGMKIAKPGINVLTTQEPFNLKFSSDYGTLKYFDKQTASITIDADAGDIAGTGTITHDLGYYPYVEVFVNVYIGVSDGTYEYCPLFGSGATVAYNANYKITTTGITLYAEINGVSPSLWNFDFLVFIYKNDLNL